MIEVGCLVAKQLCALAPHGDHCIDCKHYFMGKETWKMTAKDIHGVPIEPGDYGFVWYEDNRPNNPLVENFCEYISEEDSADGRRLYYCGDNSPYHSFEKIIPVILPPNLPDEGDLIISPIDKIEYEFECFNPIHPRGLNYCCRHPASGEYVFLPSIKSIFKTPTQDDVFKKVIVRPYKTCDTKVAVELVQILPNGIFLCKHPSGKYEEFEHAEVIEE